MGTAGNQPDNIDAIKASEIYISSGDWIIVGFLIAIIIVLIIALAIACYIKQCKIDNLNRSLSKDFTEDELKLISNYRSLNKQGKAIVNDTCKNLINRGTTLNNNKNDGV